MLPSGLLVIEPPSETQLPVLILQYTRLTASWILWLGAFETGDSDMSPSPLEGRLAVDFACAMPVKAVSGPPNATSLFCPTTGSIALTMAQRLGM
jgi:proteasome assembly chaperone 4